jgi:hypothetical protein
MYEEQGTGNRDNHTNVLISAEQPSIACMIQKEFQLPIEAMTFPLNVSR